MMDLPDGATRTIEEREQVAWNMKCAGYSYKTIGQATGVSGVQASRDVQKMADKIEAMSLRKPEYYRRLTLSRLDVMLKAIWPDCIAGDVVAIQTTLRMMERQAKILGLDSPSRIDITARIRQMALDEGLDPDRAVEEAQKVMARYRQG